MKAIIMAGGEGTRLRPLTCDCPKPMVRLLDRPVMEYSLMLLARHGVTEAAVTLGYLPKRICDYFGPSAHGVSLSYFWEKTPLGTAGGVAQAREMLTETFCVLSGDGVTDCDLTKALAFHREKGALATMVLSRTADPTPYGLVITAPDGRITDFVEKPAWGQVVSDAVNTGIYLLEPEILQRIPEGPYDFGRDLFPKMAQSGGLYGYVMDGYWCDIGDISAYLSVSRDALDGKINLPRLKDCAAGGIDSAAEIDSTAIVPRGCLVAAGARIQDGAHLEAPCYIGENAVVGRNATVAAYSVLGMGARADAFSSVKRGILWPGAHLGEGAQARGCVMGRNARLSPCARAYEGCVLGTGAGAGVDAELAPGVCLWPGKQVPDAVRRTENLVWGAAGASCFRGGRLAVHRPGYAVSCAQAYVAVTTPREVLLAHTPEAASSAVWHACAAGLMAQGAQVLDAGVCSEPQLRFAMQLMRAEGGLLAAPEDLLPLSRGGVRLSTRHQRAVCALLSRQDYPQPGPESPRPVTSSGRSQQAYVAMLSAAFRADDGLCPKMALHCRTPYLLSLAEQSFSRAKIELRAEWEDEMMDLAPGELGLWLSDDGNQCTFAWEGGKLTPPQNELLMIWTALELGETQLLLGQRSPRAALELAERYGASVSHCAASRPDWEKELSAHPVQFRLATDGLYFALCALSCLTENALTLPVWLSTMPKVCRTERTLPLKDDSRGEALRRIAEMEPAAQVDGGVCIQRENAVAWIAPDDTRPECRIITESRDMETARELCDFCEGLLKRALEKK